MLESKSKFCRSLLGSFILPSTLILAWITMVAVEPVPASLLSLTTKLDVEWEGQTIGSATVPDWNRISLSDLLGILHSGSISSEYNNLVGYDLSRTWQIGDTPDKILKLGDIASAFAPQNLTVGQVAQLGKVNLSSFALSDFPLVGNQTLKQLVAAIPNLGTLSISQIPPVQQLLGLQGLVVSPELSLSGILAQNPVLGDLKLNAIDLSQFKVNSIPDIAQAVIGNFEDWQSSFVADIPGLGNVPLGQMPNPVILAGMAVARIDRVWGAAESRRYHTVTGSYQEGFNVPCEQNCAYIELDDLENVGSSLRGSSEGQQWISGKYQQVSGGEGCLSFLNGGQEPTGRHPFGNGFKVVVMEPDETNDSIETALYFRVTSFCGESPYFIGPFPFLQLRRDDWIFLGGI